MDCNSNKYDNFFSLMMKKKTELGKSKRKQEIKINSIRNLSLSKGPLFTNKCRNILSSQKDKDKQNTFSTNKQKYSISFIEPNQTDLQNYKIDKLQLKISKLINLIDKFKNKYLNDNNGIKTEFNMLLSHSTGALKLGQTFKQSQKIPISQSQVSDTTNFSSKDNISHDDKNKVQNSKYNKKQITKKKISGINIDQMSTMFKQKKYISFTKTLNNISTNKPKFSNIINNRNNHCLTTKLIINDKTFSNNNDNNVTGKIKQKNSNKQLVICNVANNGKDGKQCAKINGRYKKGIKKSKRKINMKNELLFKNKLRNSCTQINEMKICKFENIFKIKKNEKNERSVSNRCRSERTRKIIGKLNVL
jgi:hypothetical protein